MTPAKDLTDEEIIERLQKVASEGFDKNEKVRSIHMEIPEWLYNVFKTRSVKHNTVYYKGWLYMLEKGNKRLADEQILEMFKQVHKRIDRYHPPETLKK